MINAYAASEPEIFKLPLPIFFPINPKQTSSPSRPPTAAAVPDSVLAWLYPSEHQPGLSPAQQIDTVCTHTPVANANTLHLLILIHLVPNDI